jgi:deoxyribodipyrimidine photo-lyase
MPPIIAAACGLSGGVDYPQPIVDDKLAVRAAKDRIYAIRRRTASRLEAELVYQKHGSRRPASPRQKTKPAKPVL